MKVRAVVLWLALSPCVSFSQVVSLTLGFDVNSPYGLSEPWYTIRTALLRSDDLQDVAERPDVKTATADAITKGGVLPDLDKLRKSVAESGAGATLRGVEATVEGELILQQGKLLLRFSRNEIVLQHLKELIQQEKKESKPATAEELSAYERLLRKAPEAKRWRVSGPLRWKSGLALEVRAFEKITK
jgi:hypothetical protein